MKIKIINILAGLLVFSACTDLNLNPLSEGSSESWYSNEMEINMSINDLFDIHFWPHDYDNWTDDWMFREVLSSVTAGTINSQDISVVEWWNRSYQCIAAANVILENLEKVVGVVPQPIIDKFEANARFVRAAQYAKLISHWGDVVYYTGILDIDESFKLAKTDKNIILQAVYEDYDYAASKLPLRYGSSEYQWATKGAALAMKARIALYMGDYDIARNAAKACKDLGVYQLYPDFGKLFLSSTKNSVETIFAIPRSVALGVYLRDYGSLTEVGGGGTNHDEGCRHYITRNSGGVVAFTPTWDLFCSFLCTDGLPIDESPLFNPREPFKNRDPRCTQTIVEFQTLFLGFIYQPHPDSLTVLNLSTGKYQKNNDTRTNAIFASYNGLAWKKGINSDWSDDFKSDPDKFLIRYADVLLMYAEAKIELNEIDASVLDAINQVRARAYGVKVDNISSYPAVTSTNQSDLRKILRIERRMEFALEGLRYMDLIRWRLAEKVLNRKNYVMLDVADLKKKVVDAGLWFFPATPEIDEDGMANFQPLYDAGLIKLITVRTFDAKKQYLFPIPAKEILINNNIKQNPGY